MAEHEDRGWLIANVYTKLAARRGRERARLAMQEHGERNPNLRRPAARARPRPAHSRRPVVATVTISAADPEPQPVSGWPTGGTPSRRDLAGVSVYTAARRIGAALALAAQTAARAYASAGTWQQLRRAPGQ